MMVQESGYYELLVFTEGFDDLTLISATDGSVITAHIDRFVVYATDPSEFYEEGRSFRFW